GIHHPDPNVVRLYFPAETDPVELAAGPVSVQEYEPDVLKPSGSRPVVFLTGEQMADMAVCWQALLRTNCPPTLFRFGETFVRLAKDSGNSGKNGNSGNSFRLVVMNPDRLRLRLAESAIWMSSGKNPKPVFLPDRLLTALLASDESAPLPLLRRMTTVPV